MQMEEPKIICIIGAPRTGSTLLYQIMVNMFDTFYITNYMNSDKVPLAKISEAYYYFEKKNKLVSYESNQGKTIGKFAPSEASNIFKKWFGGEHPSQTHSCRLLPGQKDNMQDTFESIQRIFNKPIVIKNAWNCFRIQSLYEMFPDIKFIWIRRDIIAASISDLATKYFMGDREKWSSATTFNYRTIQQLAYWEIVVQQQYWYSRAIEDS